MMKREVMLPVFPERIISLVPSQTELLFDLGLGERVVGITKFCIHPEEWFKSKARVGGTKTPNIEKIKALQPDLIIGNKEENEINSINELADLFPVWMSDILTLGDSLNMINKVGEITNTTPEALSLSATIKTRFSVIPKVKKTRSALYFIWKEPYMVAGKETFVDDMLTYIGLDNCISTTRYPVLTNEEIIIFNPEVILLSSEPYPFKDKHISEFKQMCPEAEVKIVDGELFSWYGSRLLKSAQHFIDLTVLY